LVQALSATAHNDNLLALNGFNAIGKLFWLHESALAKFFQLHAKGQGVEVVAHWGLLV
jgi:hypothetical protein